MRFQKLRVVGFKSFVEPAELLIEPGLTGIVGPNGCGKSNIVEAMRWVMGESSSKNMRASGMDDVIFSGAGDRPARNTAEVSLVLDNSDRTAPAGFNDADVLEITRRIEREAGSVYRINGREVRARDVQTLFADASTGARSPSMVRQGQISEIIAARPQARRRILEEAAGIAGLYARRHEASLRLKAADDNLVRLEDVLKQIMSQVDGLKRQARQAARYRTLAAEIRRVEALLYLISHRDIETQFIEAQRKFDLDTRDVAARALAQADTARLAAIAAQALPNLREAESRAAAALQRLTHARDALDGEERRTKERIADLDRRIVQLNETIRRETARIEDAEASLARLAGEDKALAEEASFAAAVEEAARLRLEGAEEAAAHSERALHEAQAALADITARKHAFERALEDEKRRLSRAEAELAKLTDERSSLLRNAGHEEAFAALSAALERATTEAKDAEARALAAERRYAEAREAELASRTPAAEAERAVQRLETEIETLRKLLAGNVDGEWPPVIDQITVRQGYERALAAAFGDDLDASTDPAAPTHWAMIDAHAHDHGLPRGARSLADFVDAPPALRPSLAHVGIVARADGPSLQHLLSPGQRLVSLEGDLWRWDGLSAAAEAPTPAARRLLERNRLSELLLAAEGARRAAAIARAQAEAAQNDLRMAAAADAEARQNARAALRAVAETRERVSSAERKRAEIGSRLAALEAAQERLSQSRDEALSKIAQTEAQKADLAAAAERTAEFEAARLKASQDRAALAEARAAAQGLTREAEVRHRRRQAIANEVKSWQGRLASARAEIGRIEDQRAEAAMERTAFDDAPAAFERQRRSLAAEIETARAARGAAADRLAEAETKDRDAERAARAALDAMAQAREERARAETRLEALRQRLTELVRTIESELGCAPSGLAALAGLKPGAPLPPGSDVEQRLNQLRQERERLGPVNLRADEELAEVEQSRAALAAERDDVAEAVKRLRQGIQNLNREGRERLIEAFEAVNTHFKELFVTLFGGGAAELQLIESDDPLEAGLEILARPPGKRPATMTLLSGGEQALTALALIFAVFLTSPAPICVLDEVDAPLDDANVERFCDLLDAMRQRTDTRFITITHNPITMARMDRLFGVTMAERGVSQLVSVDLQAAEQLREAG